MPKESSNIPDLPASGLVDALWLERHTPYSASWYAAARYRGDGPPHHRLGKKVVYRWAEVVLWLESMLSASTKGAAS